MYVHVNARLHAHVLCLFLLLFVTHTAAAALGRITARQTETAHTFCRIRHTIKINFSSGEMRITDALMYTGRHASMVLISVS